MQIFCITKISHTVAFIRTVYVQCCCSDLMRSSCAGDVGSSHEGVGHSRHCNPSLHQGLYPATSSQPVAERLQGGGLDVEPTKHHYSRTCLGRPLVWATTCLGRPQSTARIVYNNKVPGVSDHLQDATSDRVIWFNQ